MTIQEALSNLEIAGLWPVSEAARKLWRDLMLAVLDEAEVGLNEILELEGCAVTDVRHTALRTRIQKLGKDPACLPERWC